VYLIFENSTLKGELLLQAQEKQPTHIMPRGARLDAPGTLHHVMVRGIEGNQIVTDDDDRHLFVSRLSIAAAATGTKIYAWALMTNHAHLLLKSGEAGLSIFMRKFLTSYAVLYNRRHF